jgi:hypothetical protein
VIVASANLPPSVRITSPANAAMFVAPASFTFAAEATDSDGSVANVQFLLNNSPIGSSAGPNFSTNVSGLAAGNYSLTAIATDDQGAATTSDPVTVIVTNAPVKYPLAIAVLPANSGTVTLNPPQPEEGYSAGAEVTLTASANQNFAFNGWSGDATSAQNPLTITMDSAKNITANFSMSSVPTHTLTIATNPAGGGTVQISPAPNGANGTYLDGTVVTLTATAALDFAFTNWTGDVSSTNNSITLVMDADHAVTANFFESIVPRFTLTVVTNPPGAGSIQISPPPGTNGYPDGTLVTLTATAIGTNAFTNWTGSVSSTSNRITVEMDANKSVTANFVPIIPPVYTLTLNVSPTNAGVVLVTPSSTNGSYAGGTTVALAAQPNTGFRFARWTGAVNSTNNPIVLVMSGDRSVTAVFEAIPPRDFADLAGVYSGLLVDEADTNYTTSGFISIRVSRTGAYRGNATIGGIHEFVAGQFDRFGYAPLVARRATLTGSLQIDDAGLRILGTITDAGPRAKSPTLLLYRSVPPTNGIPLAGTYSLVIDPAAPIETQGAANMQVIANGSVRLRGTLGDGTVFAERTFISPDGRVPIFVRLYHGRGAIVGWIDVGPNGAAHGNLRWFRPGNSRNVNFPDGFVLNAPIHTAGSVPGFDNFSR